MPHPTAMDLFAEASTPPVFFNEDRRKRGPFNWRLVGGALQLKKKSHYSIRSPKIKMLPYNNHYTNYEDPYLLPLFFLRILIRLSFPFRLADGEGYPFKVR
jgi:hypothetical protein